MELIFSYHTAQYFCQKHSFPKGKSEEKKSKTVYGLWNTSGVWWTAYIWHLSYFTKLVINFSQENTGIIFPVQLITQHKHFNRFPCKDSESMHTLTDNST